MIKLQKYVNQINKSKIQEKNSLQENHEAHQQDQAFFAQSNTQITKDTQNYPKNIKNQQKKSKSTKNKYNKLQSQGQKIDKESFQSININLNCKILIVLLIAVVSLALYWIIYEIGSIKTIKDTDIKNIDLSSMGNIQKQKINSITNNNNNQINLNKQNQLNIKQVNVKRTQAQMRIQQIAKLKQQNYRKQISGYQKYVSQPLPTSSITRKPIPLTATSYVQAKANITTEQARQWFIYQQMLKLPFQSNDPMIKEEYEYFQRKYNISKYKEIPICVVIPSYNNVKDQRYKDNLKSILQQNYSNYHIVFIDDVSQDKTGQMVLQYLKQNNVSQSRAKVIINKQRKYAMQNLRYAAMNQCKQEQLFIIVDGDDMLIGRQVFKLFSAVMQQKDLWVMYTNFLTPRGGIGYSRQYNLPAKRDNNYRHAGFVMSHLRAYYTRLFRLVQEQDLKNQKGEYYMAANDVAIGLPILQMAHQHVQYIPQISYYYNLNTGLNNHKLRLRQQKTNQKQIKKKNKYAQLKTLFGQRQKIYEKNRNKNAEQNILRPYNQNEPFNQHLTLSPEQIQKLQKQHEKHLKQKQDQNNNIDNKNIFSTQKTIQKFSQTQSQKGNGERQYQLIMKQNMLQKQLDLHNIQINNQLQIKAQNKVQDLNKDKVQQKI